MYAFAEAKPRIESGGRIGRIHVQERHLPASKDSTRECSRKRCTQATPTSTRVYGNRTQLHMTVQVKPLAAHGNELARCRVSDAGVLAEQRRPGSKRTRPRNVRESKHCSGVRKPERNNVGFAR